MKKKHIDAVLTAELTAKDNTVSFEITKVENKLTEGKPGRALESGKVGNPIQTIEIPNRQSCICKQYTEKCQFNRRCYVHTNKGKR